MSQTLNPAVYAAAELMTDRAITAALLRDVAVMQGLSLHVAAAPAAGPSAAELARRALVTAEAAANEARRLYDAARRDIGEANRRTIPAPATLARYGAKPTVLTAERVRQRKSDAFRAFNKRRAQLLAAERGLAAARAAVAALAH